jgi:membrane associated rhomboid family serine protease
MNRYRDTAMTQEQPTTTTCYRHPDRETGRRCTRCGRPACPECLRDAAVGAHCVECVKAAGPSKVIEVRRWNARHDFLITSILIAINAAVFVIGSLRPGLPNGASGSDRTFESYALYGPYIRLRHEWWRIVTSGFLHANFFHLLMNMAVLAQLGRLLEGPLGRVRYTTLYAVGLLGGAAGALLVTPNSPTVGASGAIFGLLGCTAVIMRQRGINVWQSGIGALIVINLVITFAVPGISVGGHVGGLLSGGAAGYFLGRTEPDGRPSRAGIPAALAIGALCVVVALIGAGRSA